jgi:hypothetical protein
LCAADDNSADCSTIALAVLATHQCPHRVMPCPKFRSMATAITIDRGPTLSSCATVTFRAGSEVSDTQVDNSYWDLAADEHLDTFADIRTRVGNNASGLFVLPGEASTARRRILDPAIYREATTQLHTTVAISGHKVRRHGVVSREFQNPAQISPSGVMRHDSGHRVVAAAPLGGGVSASASRRGRPRVGAVLVNVVAGLARCPDRPGPWQDSRGHLRRYPA